MIRTTLRSLWSHKRRLISTCIAVILGVAFMAGTLVLTSTINSVFDDLFANVNKNTDAIVRGPELFKSDQAGTQRDTIPEATAEKVLAVPGVAAVSPSIATESITLLDKKGDPMGGQGPPTFVGSWGTDAQLNPYTVISGRAPEREGEAVIDRAAANDGPFKVGDSLKLVTADGPTSLKLVGITRFGDADSAGGVIFVGTTLRQAQDYAGEPGKLDTVDVRGDAGVSPTELVKRIEAAKVTSKADVLTGEQAAKEQANELKDLFGFFSKILLTFAFIALFVGVFIISNTFGILVAQRTKELALLRAIGATRFQVLGSVLLEAGIIGVVSAVLGFLSGVGLAAAALALLRGVGLDLPSASLTITGGTAAVAIFVGLAITTASAVLPAVRATRVPPIAALRDVAIDTSDRSRLRAIFGVLFLVVGAVLTIPAFGTDPTTDQLPKVGIGMALIVVAVLVLGPVLARPLSRVVGSPLPAIKGVTGRLARENAMRSPRRTASTAAALIIGVTLVGFITIFASSAQTSVTASISGGFEGDYILQPANQQSFTGASFKLADAVAKVDGVDTVTAISGVPAQLTLPDGSKPGTNIAGIDPPTYTKLFDVKMSEGDLSDLKKGQIVVGRQTAKKESLAIGDTVKVLSADGRRASFRVAAISDDNVLLGDWTITRDDAKALRAKPDDFLVAIKLDQGTSVEGIRPELKKVAKAYPTMKLQDRKQFTGSIVAQISALLNVIYGLLAVSIVIALIGIANTLSLSIHERTRELGLLRAMGMTRSQLRSSVRWEAVIVALMGTGLGLLLGLGLSYTLVQALKSQGFNSFDVPIGGMVFVVVFGAALGVIAALRPAWKASKLNVLEAISTE
ncbi:ABC transporter permease [Aquihabitans sp. G128]|uniref:ABC transporter permease n=1 Tax=Aquihabitans sp. G128 TaxID=2849779 RepID=UPI001C236F14|nr:ABC transporter permease [Aquihabitans sp. G128]QXC59935.1 ABC transporter permease [Aquihabitans sp. G128]